MELTFVNFWQDIISNPMLFITVLLTLGVIFGKWLDRRTECDRHLCGDQVYAGACRNHDECSV